MGYQKYGVSEISFTISNMSGIPYIGYRKYRVSEISGIRNIGYQKYLLSEILGIRNIEYQKYPVERFWLASRGLG